MGSISQVLLPSARLVFRETSKRGIRAGLGELVGAGPLEKGTPSL